MAATSDEYLSQFLGSYQFNFASQIEGHSVNNNLDALLASAHYPTFTPPDLLPREQDVDADHMTTHPIVQFTPLRPRSKDLVNNNDTRSGQPSGRTKTQGKQRGRPRLPRNKDDGDANKVCIDQLLPMN